MRDLIKGKADRFRLNLLTALHYHFAEMLLSVCPSDRIETWNALDMLQGAVDTAKLGVVESDRERERKEGE